MTKFAIAAVAAALLALPGVAPTSAHAGSTKADVGKIAIACFRGPWRQVIWDHAEASFVDDLVAVGYDYPTAEAIGAHICRDKDTVGKPDAMREALIKALNSSAYARRH